jgi:F-type H+-transporting ATPase subunit delta
MSLVANRYAEALFELANDKNIVAEVVADLKELKTVFSSNEELMAVLVAPKVNEATKKQMLSNLLTNANQVVSNFVQLLVDKKRLTELVAVVEAFETLAAKAAKTAQATVVSTRELTAAEREEISSSFGKLVGVEQLEITNEIDPSVIGGVRVQIGNYIYDSTVASKLEGLKRTLVG